MAGEIAEKLQWKDGSKEKIALYAVAGLLSAYASDGNLATGAVAGASSEWLNSKVADYLEQQYPELNSNTRKVIQQASAMMIGATVGAVTGGSKEQLKQGALTSYHAEVYNRQLHPDEMKWIKANAKKFAEQESERLGVTISEDVALERLITQAAQMVDFAWFKKIAQTDNQAQQFLLSSSDWGGYVPLFQNMNDGTFINADGERQKLFTASKDEYYSAGKYSEVQKSPLQC